jgi:hypothetical protein
MPERKPPPSDLKIESSPDALKPRDRKSENKDSGPRHHLSSPVIPTTYTKAQARNSDPDLRLQRPSTTYSTGTEYSTSTSDWSSSSLASVIIAHHPVIVGNKKIVPLEECANKTQCSNCGQPVVPEYTATPSFLSVLFFSLCCPCVFFNWGGAQECYERRKTPVFVCPECRVIMSTVPKNLHPQHHTHLQSHSFTGSFNTPAASSHEFQ